MTVFQVGCLGYRFYAEWSLLLISPCIRFVVEGAEVADLSRFVKPNTDRRIFGVFIKPKIGENMREFSYRSFISEIIEARTDLLDPADLAKAVVAGLPTENYLTALEEVTPQVVASLLSRDRQATRQAVQASGWVAESTEDTASVEPTPVVFSKRDIVLLGKTLGQRLWIKGVGWKLHKECTVSDLLTRANYLHGVAAANTVSAKRFESEAALLQKWNVPTVGALNEDGQRELVNIYTG